MVQTQMDQDSKTFLLQMLYGLIPAEGHAKGGQAGRRANLSAFDK